MVIPMYLFSQNQIELPCFFISEALERDKLQYYILLNNIRIQGDWNEWIKFFLTTVIKQCDKYIQIISEINDLYSKDKEKACNISRSSNMVDVIDALYQYPITTAKQISEVTNIPTTSVNRYLGQLVESKLLFTDTKGRNRTYFYLGLLSIIRA